VTIIQHTPNTTPGPQITCAALNGVCCIIVTFLVTILPETGKRELPQTLEELIDWNKEGFNWKLSSIKKKKPIEKSKT
jgi:hypothetical protein